MAYTTQASGVVPGGSSNPSVSFSQIRDAMGAPASNVRLSDYYRGGSYIKGTGNNQYVPTSGNVLPVSRLRGACRRVICTVTSNQNRINLSSVFSHSNEVWNGSSWVTGPWDEWGKATDKNVNMNANVYSDNSTSAMTVPSGAGSEIFVNLGGNGIYGYGGDPGGSNAGSGGQGYTAIYTQSNMTVSNGSIIGGGGGGGGGGRGGQEGNDGRNNRNYCCGWFCPQCSSCDRGVGGGNDGGGSGGQGGRGAWYTTGAQGGQGGQNPGNGGGGGGSGGSGGGLGSDGSNGQGGGPGSSGPGGNCQGGGGGQGGQGGGPGGGSGHWVIGNQYISSFATTSGRFANS